VIPARLSDEVQAALAEERAVVALETSVIAHGLPPGANLDAWRRSEQAIRDAGATPATIGILDGVVHVGIVAAGAERLADPQTGALKAGSGDLAVAIAQGRCAGTTVSATCELAVGAGIRVVATGGIGGVHRDATETFDVSQDLWALSRFPVAVVCSGAKVILDLPKTLEALERLGVPVLGVGTSELPAFYCATSGLPLAHRVETAAEAGQVVWERLGQRTGGIVLAFPVPSQSAIPLDEVERCLVAALAEARAQGIRGKASTPFLLDRLRQALGDRALRANVALLESNAAFAGEVASWMSSSR
jgi:pseudouridylate synthase